MVYNTKKRRLISVNFNENVWREIQRDKLSKKIQYSSCVLRRIGGFDELLICELSPTITRFLFFFLINYYKRFHYITNFRYTMEFLFMDNFYSMKYVIGSFYLSFLLKFSFYFGTNKSSILFGGQGPRGIKMRSFSLSGQIAK